MILLFLAATLIPDAPHTLAVKKCSDAWLLVRFDFDAMSKDHTIVCEVCGKEDDRFCELDWPSSDVPTCEVYDTLRNGIFAAYGRPFKNPKWKKLFAAEPWYKENTKYDDALLSVVAKRNVDKLIALRDAMAKQNDKDPSCK